jgi:hypothetical protein
LRLSLEQQHVSGGCAVENSYRQELPGDRTAQASAPSGALRQRGRVLRDTSLGDGLVFVAGNQYPFRLEGTWKSEFAPKVNMPVDVDFDAAGAVVCIRGINPQSLAGEQAAQALGAAQETAKKVAAEFQSKGLPVILSYVQLIGGGRVVAIIALIAGWFWLNTVAIDAGFLGKQGFSFYDALKLLNQGGAAGLAALGGGMRNASAGFYGFLAIVAVMAPLLPYVIKDRRAWLGSAAPLGLMLLVVLIAYWKISHGMSEATGAFGSQTAEMEEYARQMASEARKQVMQAVSLGLGAYLSIVASVYLAFTGWVKYRKTGIA